MRIINLECLLMDNDEVICDGKSLGFLSIAQKKYVNEKPKGLTELWLSFADDGSGEPGTIGCLFPSEMTAAQMDQAVDKCDYVERVSASGKPTMRQYFFS